MSTTHIEKFIEDALAGGWRKRWQYKGLVDSSNEHLARFSSLATTGEVTYSFGVSAILLDPNAWRAVGKTRGWNLSSQSPEMEWLKFGVFANHLFSGKSLDQALEALNN